MGPRAVSAPLTAATLGKLKAVVALFTFGRGGYFPIPFLLIRLAAVYRQRKPRRASSQRIHQLLTGLFLAATLQYQADAALQELYGVIRMIFRRSVIVGNFRSCSRKR